MNDPFRRVRKRCTEPGCTRVVQTLAYVPRPRCQPCRRERLGLDPVQPRGVRRAEGYWRARYYLKRRAEVGS